MGNALKWILAEWLSEVVLLDKSWQFPLARGSLCQSCYQVDDNWYLFGSGAPRRLIFGSGQAECVLCRMAKFACGILEARLGVKGTGMRPR